MQSATTALQDGSAEVINSHDQYEVFNDPRAVRPKILRFVCSDLYLNLVRSDPFVFEARIEFV